MKRIYPVLYFLITLVVIMPVSVNYIMKGGIICDWIVNVQNTAELLSSRLFLFYQEAEYITSSLYYIPIAIIFILSKNIVLAYRIHMLFIQVGTGIGAWLFFRRIATGKNAELVTLMGTALYLLSPFRIYVCYDLADIPQAFVWMILPFWGYTIIRLHESMRHKYIILSAFLFAAIAYVNSAFVLPAIVISLILALAWRDVRIFSADCLGAVIAMPAMARMFVYIAKGETGIRCSLSVMIEEGYYPGDIFHSFSYRAAHPGLGLGMCLYLAVYVWLIYIERQWETAKKSLPLIITAFIFLILSLKILPWDALRSMDNFMGRIGSYFYTTEIFMGMFYTCLCVLAMRGNFESKDESINNNICFWTGAVIVMCFAAGSYLCGNILYDRYPLT